MKVTRGVQREVVRGFRRFPHKVQENETEARLRKFLEKYALDDEKIEAYLKKLVGDTAANQPPAPPATQPASQQSRLLSRLYNFLSLQSVNPFSCHALREHARYPFRLFSPTTRQSTQ